MKFLHKDQSKLNAHLHLSYDQPRDREEARRVLVDLQCGFCGYSERYLKPLDSVEIEHLDPRLKGKPQDDIRNWHAVLRWMNAHKARDVGPYLPLPSMETDLCGTRIRYESGEFVCDPSDVEAGNLLLFLGVNRPEVAKERGDHVQRVRRLKEICEKNGDNIEDFLRESPEDLSFATALETDLGIPASSIIDERLRRNDGGIHP